MICDREAARPIGVVVVEANPISARIIADALKAADFEVRIHRGSVEPLLAPSLDWSVVVLGPSEKSQRWNSIVPRLVSSGVRVLVLSDDEFDDAASMLLFAGASGFLCTADAAAAELVGAVHAIAIGESALHPSVVKEILDLWRHRDARVVDNIAPRRTSATLTARENEVVTLLSRGLTARLIARELGIAEKTIEAHKSRLFAKLGARNQAHAVQLARERGLL